MYTRPIFGDEVIFDHIGEIGDTIGGLTAPVIGLLNAVLLYLTLREQFEFNEKQKKSVKEVKVFVFWDNIFNIAKGQGVRELVYAVAEGAAPDGYFPSPERISVCGNACHAVRNSTKPE